MSFRALLLVIALVFGTTVSAEIDRPKNLNETLGLLASALQDSEHVVGLRINTSDVSLEVSWASSTTTIHYPHNLHAQLLNAETALERQELLDDHVEAATVAGLKSDTAYSEDDLENILPILRHVDYLNSFVADNPGQALLSNGQIGDSLILFTLNSETHITYLTKASLDELGVTQSKLFEIAARNLEAKLPELSIEGDGIYSLTYDGYYETAFLTHEPLWRQIDEQLGEILIGFPTRDLVVFVDGEQPEARSILKDIVADFNGTGAYPVSELIYSWNNDGWVLVD
ncbi:DUF1444 family protein [Roseovarius sp. 2305UL8-3]|uniref:DUF1444 family protein n=1 Tax=Roseovarius conchicola TaxID=3121636 RepID=UPI0035278E10